MATKSTGKTTNRSSNTTRSNSRSGSKSTTRSNSSRSASTRSTSNKRTPNKNTKAYEKQRAAERAEAATPPENLREIYTIIFFAVNLILVLGTYGVCGKIGKALSGFFFGLFGSTFYVLPLFFFIAFVFIMANGPKPKLIKKLIWFTVLFMCIGFICQLIVGTKSIGVKDLYFLGYTDHRGGGIFFGGIIVFIAKFLSRVGAVIITVLLSIISIIEITNVRLVQLVKSIFMMADQVGYDDDEDEYDEYDYEDDEDIKSIIRDSREAEEQRLIEKKAAEKKAAGKKKKALLGDLTTEDASAKGFEQDILTNITVFDTEEKKLERSQASSDKTITSTPIRKKSINYDDVVELKVDPRTYNDPFESSNTADASALDFPINAPTDDTINVSTENTAPVPAPTPTPEVKKVEEPEHVTQKDRIEAKQEISNEIDNQAEPKKVYKFPPVSLLKSGGRASFDRSNDATVKETALTLKKSFESFGVNVTITNCSVGPAITRYELQPDQGVRVNKILSLESDIKMALAATDIRIEAPIPGKAAIGIEIPNKNNQTVFFRDLIDNDLFRRFKSNVAFAVGKDISGQIIITDIAKMPHLLIAGSTGSGKSVCINTLIMSMLYKSSPEDVRMIMVDPKMVELTAYNGIPHLLIPVVTDPKKAAGALNWAVDEMTKRYQLFANYNVRNIEGFNKKVAEQGPNEDPQFKHLYQLIVIVDELADLMMVAHKEVEDSIVRLSQLARAAGIHLVIATQRPSVDVITGLIKANVPSRIAFAVSSGTDSRTIIDMVGAEKLLGKGDMLFYPTGYTKPVRVQGAFIDDDEVIRVVDYIKDNTGETSYDETVTQSIDNSAVASGGSSAGGSSSEDNDRYDELFEDAARYVIEKDKASIGYLQRMLRIGFNRAARIMDQMEEFGVVGPEEGTKPRRILMNMTEFEEKMDSLS